MRVVLSGGGTGGHIYPALAVAGLLRAEGHDEITFVGTPDGPEARLAPEAGLAFLGIPARGFDRSRPLSLLSAGWLFITSTVRAFRFMRRFKPDVVVGFGGYVSMPVGFGAVLAGRPLVIHEQNSIPGLANRFLSRWARRVAVTYDESTTHLAHPDRVVRTGNPVRPEVLQADRDAGRGALGIPEDAVMLLVFGGSRGARHINSAVSTAAGRILRDPKVHVVHAAGRDEVAAVEGLLAAEDVASERYHVIDYIVDMGGALAAADLVVARAGATSIAEITALGVPAVLVPFPYATDDHQTLNARALAVAGGAVVVPDKALDEPEFIETVTGLLSDGSRRATMAAASRGLGVPDATRRVADLLIETAGITTTSSLKEDS